MKKLKYYIPNSITCLNALFGTLAIIAAAKADVAISGLYGWQWSILCIAIAAVADFFDGFAARLLDARHPIGAELDSLSDQVSFGVAPAALMIFTLMQAGSPWWVYLFPALIPVATALRLAKFNIDTRQTYGFLGVPVPANAIFWMGYCAWIQDGCLNLTQPYILIPCVLAISWLMTSEVPMLSLKFKNWSLRDNLARYLLILGAVVLFIIFGLKGLLLIILFYLVLSLFCAKNKENTHAD